MSTRSSDGGGSAGRDDALTRMRALLEAATDATSCARAAKAQQWQRIDDAFEFARLHTGLYLTSGIDAPQGSQAAGIAMRSAAADIACRLGITEGEVRAIAGNAWRLRTRTPDLWNAYLAGRVDDRNARAAGEVLATVPERPDTDHIFDLRFTWHAADQQLTPAKFRLRAGALREQLHPQDANSRHRTAYQQRAFRLEPLPDGMCRISLDTDLASGATIQARIDAMAQRLAHTEQRDTEQRHTSSATGAPTEPGAAHGDEAGGLPREERADAPAEPRTLPQLRHDIARDLLADGTIDPDRTPDVTVTLMVTIPALTLLGHGDRPATLDGVGPIPLDLARRLAATAPRFRRVLTDPVDGSILDAETNRRYPTALLDWWVRYLNGTCRFPGCNRSARACDIDHTIPWSHAGPTRAANLGPLTPGHHTVKHHGRWTLEQPAPGIFRWTSPTGHRTTIYPDDTPPNPDNPPP